MLGCAARALRTHLFCPVASSCLSYPQPFFYNLAKSVIFISLCAGDLIFQRSGLGLSSRQRDIAGISFTR